MSTAMDILDNHVQLAMWSESDIASSYWEAYLKTEEGDAWLMLHPGAGERYAESCAHMMGLGETYYVAPDMCDVIEEAAGTVPRSPLRAHMIPTRVGWVQFDRTIELGHTEDGDPWGTIGFSWRIEDAHTNLDGVEAGIRWVDDSGNNFVGPGLTIIWWRDMADADRDGTVTPTTRHYYSWAVPGQLTGWAFDISWDGTENRKNFPLDETGDIQRQVILTTFNLLMDELVVVRKERAPRPAVRRAAKALKSPDFGDVNVVDLRKIRTLNYEPPEPDDDADPVHWTHRWIVRPHWRTVNRGTAKEKHVYIRKHIKGPENRPLIVKDRLGRLIR